MSCNQNVNYLFCFFLVNRGTLLYLCERLNNQCGEFEGNSAFLHVLDVSKVKLTQQTLHTAEDRNSFLCCTNPKDN